MVLRCADKSRWCGWYAMPEDMGHPMVFLNSDMAGYISGQDLNIS